MTEATLKPGWCKWRFDQIAINVNDRIDNPSESDFEYYVGLEHIDSDSLKLRRWGSPSDVESTKLIFRKGDIIFGKRRVYQRKVAVAEFDGICSAHALVLRANSDVILPGLLPFLMQSNLFMERAKSISVGSLSPTINWKTLAKEEISLPSLEQQKKITDLLQCLERVLEDQRSIELQAKVLTESLFSQFISQDWPIVSLKSSVQGTQYGLSTNAGESGTYPILRMMNIENGLCVENDIKYLDLSIDDFETYRLENGDVLFNRTNSYELVGRTGVYTLEGDHVFASYLVRVKVKEDKLDPYYLTTYLNSDRGRQQVLSFATRGVSQSNVNAQNLLRVKIPLPPLDKQKDLLKRYQSVWKSSLAAGDRRYSVELLKKKYLNQIFPVGDYH
jgi:restriction endonuclease S subunit